MLSNTDIGGAGVTVDQIGNNEADDVFKNDEAVKAKGKWRVGWRQGIHALILV